MNDPLASPLVADQEMGEAPSGRLDVSNGEDLYESRSDPTGMSKWKLGSMDSKWVITYL